MFNVYVGIGTGDTIIYKRIPIIKNENVTLRNLRGTLFLSF